MKNNPKVVSFERDPSYIHHRAMLNRRGNNPLDALELLRHAVESDPQNMDYRIDLSEMYIEVGSIFKSNQVLLDITVEPDAPPECFFRLGMNRLLMNDSEGARRLLALYEDLSPEGEYRQQSEDIRRNLGLAELFTEPPYRRKTHAVDLANHAFNLMGKREYARACKVYERSLHCLLSKKTQAMYALALAKNGEKKQAEDAIVKATTPAPSVELCCLASQVYAQLGQDEKAAKMLETAKSKSAEGPESLILICALAEMGMHQDVADSTRQELTENPLDCLMLHMRAVALHHLGEPDERLAPFWQRILRIDPEDTVAQYYLDACKSGKLSEVEPCYVYEVPEEESKRRIRYLIGQPERSMAEVRIAWQEDALFRKLILWASRSPLPELQRTTVSFLAAIDDPQAESLLRLMMFLPTTPESTRRRAREILQIEGRDLSRVFLPPDMPRNDEILHTLSAGERQLIRSTSAMMFRQYGEVDDSDLVTLWKQYRENRKTRIDPLRDSEEIAAALAQIYLQKRQAETAPLERPKNFKGSPRKIDYYKKRMSSVLSASEGEKEP